jgi:hydrogenase expression/formation protein HypD
MARYLDEFREPRAAEALRREILERAARLPAGRVFTTMEVCGSHTMAIGRCGIRGMLPPNLDLVSGPGCPVCVTETGYIDAAVALARAGRVVATFGDLLHVPGSETTLAEARAAGGAVEACYSPARALELAAEMPGREVVFLAVGFETTVGPVVSLVRSAEARGTANLSLLVAFKLVPPALEALAADPGLRVDAFLCPAHVSAIIGARAYEPFVARHRRPCVVAGFEPLDILLGLRGILDQWLAGEARVENQYARVVRPGGNPAAQRLIETYLEPADAAWRGIGILPASGLRLRDAFARYDAERRFGFAVGRGRPNPGCRCGEVIRGRIKPPDCPLFRRGCDPSHPVGPCMVSSEGTCAAYFAYGPGA